MVPSGVLARGFFLSLECCLMLCIVSDGAGDGAAAAAAEERAIQEAIAARAAEIEEEELARLEAEGTLVRRLCTAC